MLFNAWLTPALWLCAKVKGPETLSEKHPLATNACKQFSHCLTALIASWIAFYGMVFLWQMKQAYSLEPGINFATNIQQAYMLDPGIGFVKSLQPYTLEPWIDFLNNMQAVFLFALYWTLAEITIPDPDSKTPASKKAESVPLALILNYSLWAVLVFQLVDLWVSRSGWSSSRFWVQLASGLAVGACMALVVGCLESEYLKAPGTRISTAFLYGYTVLQLAYVGFNYSPSREIINLSLNKFLPVESYLEGFATITSLPLKILFIVFCYWALKEGRLIFYMEKTRKLIETAPEEWKQFCSAQKPLTEGSPEREGPLTLFVL